MAGAVFGEVQVSLFVAGAVFGEVQVSLFVAGAVFGEIWNDSRSAKCCIFQYKMLVVGVKGHLGCEAGCGLTVSWSDHARIMLGSCDVAVREPDLIHRTRVSGCVALRPVARTVTSHGREQSTQI